MHKGGTYVDGTVGLGGHTARIVESLAGEGRIIAIDRDEEALEEARDLLLSHGSIVSFHHENFRNLPLLLNGLGLDGIDGCLLDLGVSSPPTRECGARIQLQAGGSS